MEKSKLIEQLNKNTERISDLVRKYTIAGLAIIWLFKSSDEAQPLLAADVRIIVMIFSLTLAVDFLQYFASFLIQTTVLYDHEKGVKSRQQKMPSEDLTNAEEDTPDPNDVKYRRSYNYPGLLFFYIKAMGLLIGYIFLVLYLFEASGIKTKG
ncbi:MAG: hypothetical protein WCF67_19545 [Chitinophagaceae bacterium]